MKKYIITFCLLIASLTFVLGGISTAYAASYLQDNYSAYIVASGESTGGDGITAYYSKIGDGNGVMTFDLLHYNGNGWFGVACGNVDNLSNLEELEGYILSGKSNKTSLTCDKGDFSFVSGNTYKVTFNAGKTLVIESKPIKDEGAGFKKELTATMSFSSNLMGLIAVSDGMKSATAIIDNYSLIDLKGSYVYSTNGFDEDDVKQGTTKVVSYNLLTGEKSSIGGAYISKDIMFTVSFVDETGALLGQQDVCLYGKATGPSVADKNDLVFVGWSEDVSCVTSDMVVHPIYGEPSEDDNGDNSSQSPSSSATPSKPQKGGCGGVMSAQAVGLVGIATLLLCKKRRG